MASEAFIGRLRAASEKADVVTTVCTGSALLARTGLMDGRPATSNKIAWDWVVQQGPKVLWKRKARWVDDGNLVTSSGVSAGTDMALALIARMHGREMALTTACTMEYTWHETGGRRPLRLAHGWGRAPLRVYTSGRASTELSILRVRRRPSLVEPRSFPRSAMTLPRRRVSTGQPVIGQPSQGL